MCIAHWCELNALVNGGKFKKPLKIPVEMLFVALWQRRSEFGLRDWFLVIWVVGVFCSELVSNVIVK